MPGFELFDESEKKEIQDVMDSGILMRYGFTNARNGHWKAKEMESLICKAMGSEYSLLLSSGTAAITTALAALGVGAGDEVIIPPFTFVATYESIMILGAIPIMVDINDTLCLDPASVEKAITPKTKAVVPVHMCGAMAEMDELLAICKKHNLILLEDACQAMGASYKGKMLGTMGEAGCYSFDFNKIVTCGEGGAIVTNNKDLYVKADMYHDHGHDHTNDDRGAEGHPYSGYNFRISELSAAVGCAQIRKLQTAVDIQRKNKKIIKDALATIPEVTFRRLPDANGDSATFITFFLPSEELAKKASEALKAEGVDSVAHWFNNNWHYVKKWDHFKELKFMHPLCETLKKGMPDYAKADFAKSDAVISRTLSMNIKISWTEEEVKARAEKMVKAIKSVL